MSKNQFVKKEESFGKFDFVKSMGMTGGFSALMVLVSLIYLGIHGIDYGIDFKGGTEIQVKYSEGVTIDQVRGAFKNLGVGEVGVQRFGESPEFVIRFQGQQGKTDKETNELLQADIAKVKTALESGGLKDLSPDFRRVDSVGPQVGAELKKNGFLAVFYCLLVILIYVGLRFDYTYSPGAVICLAHDTIITLAIFVAVGKEVNIPILAAVLTLIGYSLNDTIVVFDRIRETEDTFSDKPLAFVVNKAINDTLARTIITSSTTFVCGMFLYLFAGGTIEDIAFAICVGIFFGTYSSIFVAAPLILVADKFKLVPKPQRA